MKHHHHPRLALGLGILLAGCMNAPTRGQVGVTEVDSAVPAESRLALADNETFENPLPSAKNAMPDYPSSMLLLNLAPQAVCVRVSIDEKGKVTATAPIGAGPDCPAEANAAADFYEAAQNATNGWKYEPAFRCVYPKGTKPNGHGCYGKGVKEVPQAVSLVYRFVFEQIDGKGAVRIGD